MPDKPKGYDIETMRRKLADASGKGYWRGIEELADTDEFQAWLDDEFPARSSIPDVDRRSFLKLMGASLALAGLAGCRNLPQEKIVPYVKAPEERFAGEFLQYATAMPFAGYGFGLLATSFEGRPTKLEGNPDHPASLGSTDVYSQGEILQFYDPDRGTVPYQDGMPSTWEQFAEFGRNLISAHSANGGTGLRILTETVTSPTLYRQIQALLKALPNARWHQFSSVNRDNERLGSQLAFGRFLDAHYDFTSAPVVLSLDGDFLACSPEHVRHTRDFMVGRNPEAGTMNRLYCIESTFTTTGLFADHRATAKPSEIEDIARYIAARVGAEGGPGKLPSGISSAWMDAVIADLTAAKGSSIVVTGDRQTGPVHALVHAINHALGNVGRTVNYSAPIEPAPVVQHLDLAQLTSDINAGRVDTLFIFGGNPANTAPADIPFTKALQSTALKHKVRLGLYQDETSALCNWYLPESHFLESWSDVRSYDGTASIVQPLIAPLYDTRAASEVIGILLKTPLSDHELVRATWPNLTAQPWRDALNKGTIAGTAAPLMPGIAPRAGFSATRGALPRGEVEAVFAPDPTIYDGRYANNGWLQELPKPLTKLSWDNAVILSPQTATRLNVVYQDNVEVAANGATVVAPVYVLPGHPDDVVTLHIGYGRENGGKVAEGTGFNFNVLRGSNLKAAGTAVSLSPWIGAVSLKKGSGTFPLASSQTHHSMSGREIVREGTFAEYQKNPTLSPETGHEDQAILYNLTSDPDWKKPEMAQWAMVIDLNTCTGCGACEIACQAENNISTVGKDQVQRGRIMHWIRVDRYFRVMDNGAERDFNEPISEVESINPAADQGALNPNNVTGVCMPIPCMHCETAPCEPVCPVAATIHSHEGLNQMVYNRCVGTRYCSNNCPYKVRRFNFYNYQFRQKNFNEEKDIPLLKMLNNPDVTVRGRGVMEKCTYCVQRINHARIEAKKEGRDIKDGEVVPACAQACASKSIVFGNMADPNARVTQLKRMKRNYGLLTDLNTQPRTTYLGKVRNPNPAIKGSA